ncbi:6-phospho-3-hexuloisomerase [Microbacterium saperdae]|uniref:3-hexulose-6-phosphate isomerase n=1 Tax=Microbacterium saperdae TaxID=69368 RepID=A0A543BJ25_9MICO|nr:6-phospho-3-hexuloisomerase [Microbacterium saperdae]TQL84763.1 3-hexulose-6-phosphate isomerase [Microbacterium saperdae]GGM64241.1 6-phospho 3-hexuloisomerase [Microbacterium saperdae]
MSSAALPVVDALHTVQSEVDAALRSLAETDAAAIAALADAVHDADRVFLLGAGRSGIALRMTAMRLMHLGLTVFVVGDTTTPAIERGDLLLTASGSGTTTGIVRAAAVAHELGAAVATITTAPASPVAALSSVIVTVPAAGKLDRSGTASAQYAGGLFEQTVVLLGDALFHTLWQRSGLSADELWPRHSNLE